MEESYEKHGSGRAESKLYGTVQRMPAGRVGAWTVNGREIVVTRETRIKEEYGKAIPGVELEVVDETGRPVAVGTTGELRARGPNVMLGYWRDEASTAEKIRNGWLLTGDLAETDSEGWIYHRGRQNAIVKIAGFRVHPTDLEEFAVRQLSASQAVAVAYEAPQVGTRLALFLTGSDLRTHAEIMSKCREALPRHIVPGFVRTLDSIPLNPSLKVDRPLLTQIAERDSKMTGMGQESVPSITKGGNP
ncbi:MAG: AMP-binding protein, partial [Schlesneria sp.]